MSDLDYSEIIQIQRETTIIVLRSEMRLSQIQYELGTLHQRRALGELGGLPPDAFDKYIASLTRAIDNYRNDKEKESHGGPTDT